VSATPGQFEYNAQHFQRDDPIPASVNIVNCVKLFNFSEDGVSMEFQNTKYLPLAAKITKVVEQNPFKEANSG
jgi:hypothetical protein